MLPAARNHPQHGRKQQQEQRQPEAGASRVPPRCRLPRGHWRAGPAGGLPGLPRPCWASRPHHAGRAARALPAVGRGGTDEHGSGSSSSR
jgi:hypothetical protein